MSNITKEQVIEWLSGQSVLDLAALVKDLEGKWGVSAAAAVVRSAALAAARPLLAKRRGLRPRARCQGQEGAARCDVRRRTGCLTHSNQSRKHGRTEARKLIGFIP